MFTSVTSVFFSGRRRHTRWPRDWSSDVCSSDLAAQLNLCKFIVAGKQIGQGEIVPRFFREIGVVGRPVRPGQKLPCKRELPAKKRNSALRVVDKIEVLPRIRILQFFKPSLCPFCIPEPVQGEIDHGGQYR